MPEALPAVTHPLLAEGGGQLREPFERRVGPHVIVLREELDALAALELDRDDFVGEASLGPGPATASCWLRSAYRSCSSRDTPYFAAQFSAVAAIVQPQCVSSSADHSVSSSCPWPRRRPLRRPRMTCGAWLMLSMPPVSTTSASPRSISCAPLIAAWMPDPHNRLTVSAGTSIGRPALSPTCRAP